MPRNPNFGPNPFAQSPVEQGNPFASNTVDRLPPVATFAGERESSRESFLLKVKRGMGSVAAKFSTMFNRPNREAAPLNGHAQNTGRIDSNPFVNNQYSASRGEEMMNAVDRRGNTLLSPERAQKIRGGMAGSAVKDFFRSGGGFDQGLAMADKWTDRADRVVNHGAVRMAGNVPVVGKYVDRAGGYVDTARTAVGAVQMTRNVHQEISAQGGTVRGMAKQVGGDALRVGAGAALRSAGEQVGVRVNPEGYGKRVEFNAGQFLRTAGEAVATRGGSLAGVGMEAANTGLRGAAESVQGSVSQMAHGQYNYAPSSQDRFGGQAWGQQSAARQGDNPFAMR